MKKIFLSLLLGFVGLISFGNGYYLYNGGSQNLSVSKSSTYELGPGICIKPYSNTIGQNTQIYENGVNIGNLQYDYIIFCFSDTGYIETNSALDRNFGYTMYDLNSYISGFINCPEVNTGDILSGSCDTNYCVENDLCPVPSNFSQLFINDLEFPGKPLINVNIPDYIHWDYSSNDTGFDLYVGSGYDQNYIDSVLKINSYRPDSRDFTNIFVSGLTLIFPYLIFALFIVFMRKLIKRIFKH